MASINPDTGEIWDRSDGVLSASRPAIRRTLATHGTRLDALESVDSVADQASRIAVLEGIVGYPVATLAELVAALTTETLIVLTSDITVTSLLTVPLGTEIVFGPYMLIKGTGGVISFSGYACAGRRQIFSGWEAGDIYGNFSTHEIYPEWWGLVGSTYTDGEHDLAINAAIRTYGPRGTLTITSAATADAGAATELTVTSVYTPATYYMAVGIRIRVESSSADDTEYDGWWTVTAVTDTTVTINKSWTDTMTGSAYFTITGTTGNRILLAAGTYWVSSTLDLRNSYSHLVGAGSGATVVWATLNWTPSEWFSGAFGVWEQLNTDPNYGGLWDIGMTTDSTSHAYMVMIGSSSADGGADFRAGVSSVKFSGAYAVRKWPTRRISILGGNGWAEENMVFRDIAISSFSGFGIGWWGADSINTLNGVHIENIWITNATRRGAIPVFVGAHAGNFSINMGTIDCSLRKAQSAAWATDDTALGGTVAGAGRGTFTAAVTNVITTSATHSLKVGDEVRFATTGTLPAGLTVGTRYYVLTIPATNTMTVAATPDGTVIDITDTGTGTHSWIDYVDDWPLFAIYCAGLHTDISNFHIEGCGMGVWVWANTVASSVSVSNIDGYYLMDSELKYYDDPARVNAPGPADPSADGTCFLYSTLVGIGAQFGQPGEAGTYNSYNVSASLRNLRCVGLMRYRLRDYMCNIALSAYGSGEYPNQATGTITRYDRGCTLQEATVTTISSAADNGGGTTALTVGSISGFSDTNNVKIAVSTSNDTEYATYAGFTVTGAPSGNTIIINKAWSDTLTGYLYKAGTAVTTNYELIY